MLWTCSIVDRPKKRLFGPSDESAVLIIVLHTSAVLVTIRASKKKKAKIISDRKIIMAIFPEFGFFFFCRILVIFTGIGGRNKKTPAGNHFGPHGIWRHSGCIRSSQVSD